MRLNLGCGNDIKPNYINVDIIKSEGVDLIQNLEKYPYSFKDNSFDLIEAHQVIEHLTDLANTIKELHRILIIYGKGLHIEHYFVEPLFNLNPYFYENTILRFLFPADGISVELTK